MKKEDLIKKYHMNPHPEGGYFVETYRSPLKIQTEFGERSASTAIYFLITEENISHFHRLRSDEGWHFHLGAPLKILEITSDGRLIETLLGGNDQLQYIVPAGHWFASTSLGEYSFVSCTVSPGFDFEDFEMAKKQDLFEKFPKYGDIINKFTLES
jgi:predicted cupin superfamily sugar epimerase